MEAADRGGAPVTRDKFSPEGVEAIRRIAREVFQEEISRIITEAFRIGAASPDEQPKTIDRP